MASTLKQVLVREGSLVILNTSNSIVSSPISSLILPLFTSIMAPAVAKKGRPRMMGI